MANPRTPLWLVVLNITKYPATEGTLTLRYSMKRPVAFPGALFTPRLKSIGPISRAASDPDGNVVVSSASFVINDEDGAVADLLVEGEPTEYWLQREVAIYCISQEGKDAGLTIDDVQPVFRGWISDVQPTPYEVHVSCAGVLGALMSKANLDRKALQYRFKDLVDNPAEGNADLPVPIYIGQFSDLDAVDKLGEYAERGIVPVFELCEINIDNIDDPPTAGLPTPPVITASSVVGTTGEQTLFYGVTLVTPFGESRMSNIVSCNGASARSLSNYNRIEGTYDIGDPGNPNHVRVWVGNAADALVGYLDAADGDGAGNFGYLDGAAHWPTPTRDELDVIKHMTPPTTDTTENWSFMLICLAYGYQILKGFSTNLADGVLPKRIEIPVEERGVTTIFPDDPEWPFPDPWIERNGVRLFGFLQRGNRLAAHRAGNVTFAVSLAGPFIAAKCLDKAFRQVAFLLNEHAFKNAGTGYSNQTYGTLETYANGDALLETSSFEACQTLSEEWLGDSNGYRGQVYIIDPEETWRDVIAKCCKTFGFRITENRFGQVRAFLINTEEDTVVGRHFRAGIEIKRIGSPAFAHDQVLNKITVSYYFDIDAGNFRSVGLPLSTPSSIAAHVPGGVDAVEDRRGVREQNPFECPFTNHEDTALDVGARELSRRKRRPRYMSFVVPLLGLDHDIGDRARITCAATRDVATSAIIMGHTIYPDDDEVELLFQDLRSIVVVSSAARLGDEAGPPNLAPQIGDEIGPPVTAPEIG